MQDIKDKNCIQYQTVSAEIIEKSGKVCNNIWKVALSLQEQIKKLMLKWHIMWTGNKSFTFNKDDSKIHVKRGNNGTNIDSYKLNFGADGIFLYMLNTKINRYHKFPWKC